MSAAQKGRFWGGDDTDSSDESSSSGSSVEEVAVKAGPVGGARAGRFAYESESDESDEGNRVARSVKQRTWDNLMDIIKRINNHLKINNWAELQDEFSKLLRAVEKADPLISKEGVPRFYIRSLVTLEEAAAGINKEAVAKMNKANAKSFNRVRGMLNETKLKYKKDIEDFKAKPDVVDEAELAASAAKKAAAAADSDSSDDEVVIGRAGVTIVSKRHRASSSEDSSDGSSSEEEKPVAKRDAKREEESEDEWSDDESSSEESDDDAHAKPRGRDYWLKKNTVVADEKKRKDEHKKAKKPKVVAQSEAASGAVTVDVTSLEGKVSDASGILGKAWTQSELVEKVEELVEMRKRKKEDLRVVISRLSALAEVSIRFGAHVAIPTIMQAVGARFDMSRGYDSYLERTYWKRSVRDLSTILSILDENKALTMAQADTTPVAVIKKKKATVENADGEVETKEAEAPADPNVVRVVGDVAVFIDMLYDEYIKSLQHMDPHKTDYVLRIGDEQSIAVLSERAMGYYERVAKAANTAGVAFLGGQGQRSTLISSYEDAQRIAVHSRNLSARLAILRIEQMYYKHDAVASQLRVAAAASEKRAEVASIAASAAAQCLAEFRAKAVESHNVVKQAQTAQQQAAQTPGGKPATEEKKTDKEKAEAEAASAAAAKALAAAADAALVGDAAAKAAEQLAMQRGKKGLTVAAGIVAKSVVGALAAVEGSLLSVGAIATSRSAQDMETLADIEAPKALAEAEAAGTDLQELSTATISAEAGLAAGSFDSARSISELAAYVYRYGETRSKTRAVLLHIYHHALHDRFVDGRDLLLMSKLQEHISSTDVKMQVQFNRSMVMLGIAAFRLGMWHESHECLAEITGSGHIRELLAQGLSQNKSGSPDRDADEEREERRRLVPYHMHINIELADACALTAAMLLEVPNIAAAEHDSRRSMISRTYRRLLDTIDSKTFVGPPETTRDTIMMAGLALAEGDWKRTCDMVGGLKVWSLWSSRGLEAIREKLLNSIKEVGLVAYLYTYSVAYDSMSLSGLAEMFGLTFRGVNAIVSKLIYNNEIPGKLDQPTGTVVLHRAPPSRLHALALDFADRVADLAEFNERALAQRTGSDRFASLHDDAGRFRSADGQYRRNKFDQRKIGSAQFAGRGRGRGRGGAAGNRLAQYTRHGSQATGRREYRQRGY